MKVYIDKLDQKNVIYQFLDALHGWHREGSVLQFPPWRPKRNSAKPIVSGAEVVEGIT